MVFNLNINANNANYSPAAAYDAIAGNEDVYFNGLDVSESTKEALTELIDEGLGFNEEDVIKTLIRKYKEDKNG